MSHLVRLLRGVHLQIADPGLCPSGTSIASFTPQAQPDIKSASCSCSKVAESFMAATHPSSVRYTLQKRAGSLWPARPCRSSFRVRNRLTNITEMIVSATEQVASSLNTVPLGRGLKLTISGVDVEAPRDRTILSMNAPTVVSGLHSTSMLPITAPQRACTLMVAGREGRYLLLSS